MILLLKFRPSEYEFIFAFHLKVILRQSKSTLQHALPHINSFGQHSVCSFGVATGQVIN